MNSPLHVVSDKYEMNIFLKHTIKQWIPPVMMRWWKEKGAGLYECGRPKLGVGGARLPGGKKFHMRPSVADREVFRQIFLDYEYSVAEFAQARNLSKFYESINDPLIVDAGANIGAASVWFALKYPRATVVAVEPDNDNFEMLKKNTLGFPKIHCINAAIASVAGTLYLSDPGQGAWAYRTAPSISDNSYGVPAITVESLLGDFQGKSPFIFKIDIEGAEAELFSHPSSIVNNFKLIGIELHDWMLPGVVNSRNFLKWHAEHNRDLVFRGENAFSFGTEIPSVNI